MTDKTILGLNAAGFNTASALVVDGDVVFAVEEERLSREKRSRKFPIQGIRAALAHAGLEMADVDAVAMSWNPAINLEAHSDAQSGRSRYLGEIFYSAPSHLMTLYENREAALSRQSITFADGVELDIVHVTHHLAHAGSFFFSPFEDAAVLTMDAFGERQSVTFCDGTGNRLEELWSQDFPHALGSFYAAFTEFCGFATQADEWKLMGASSYGDPERFHNKIASLIRLDSEAGFELDLSYFNHYQFHRPGFCALKMQELLGLTANRRDEPLSQDYYDIAAAAQRVLEESVIHLARGLHARTKRNRLVLAGGVALNCVANGKILAETPFDELFVPPVPDDSGGSLGAAFYLRCQIEGRERSYVMEHNYLGPEYDTDEIGAALVKFGIRHQRTADPAQTAAGLIAEGKIIGWFQGRLEFGDRALGNRSILADPRDADMKDKVNETVKYREPFRPFAPAILGECVDDYFLDAGPTPFMEKAFVIRAEKRAEIPAVTHVDGTGRLQTVTRDQNARFWELIDRFRGITEVPVVLNTSFNLKGEPIVCSPQDAVRTFYTSGLDALVIGDFLVRKDD